MDVRNASRSLSSRLLRYRKLCRGLKSGAYLRDLLQRDLLEQSDGSLDLDSDGAAGLPEIAGILGSRHTR